MSIRTGQGRPKRAWGLASALACAVVPNLARAAPADGAADPLPRVAEVASQAEARRTDVSGYADLLTREARARGLPPAVADAVAFVESGFNPRAVGSVGELGLMQVRPATAALLGHTGPPAALLDPATNVRFGVAYLARAWTLAGGDLCRALMKYRAGHGEERMTARSVEYCRRARDRLAAMGSPLAAAALPVASPSATPARLASAPAGRTGREAVLVAVAARLWAEHSARIHAIEAKTDRIMRGG